MTFLIIVFLILIVLGIGGFLVDEPKTGITYLLFAGVIFCLINITKTPVKIKKQYIETRDTTNLTLIYHMPEEIMEITSTNHLMVDSTVIDVKKRIKHIYFSFDNYSYRLESDGDSTVIMTDSRTGRLIYNFRNTIVNQVFDEQNE